MKINIGKLKKPEDLHLINVENLYKKEIDPFVDTAEEDQVFGLTLIEDSPYGFFWGVDENGESPTELDKYIVEKLLPQVKFKDFHPDEGSGNFQLDKKFRDAMMLANKEICTEGKKKHKTDGSYHYIYCDKPEDLLKFTTRVGEILKRPKPEKPPKPGIGGKKNALPSKAVVTKKVGMVKIGMVAKKVVATKAAKKKGK